MGKVRLNQDKSLAQSHSAGQGQGYHLAVASLTPKPALITTALLCSAAWQKRCPPQKEAAPAPAL